MGHALENLPKRRDTEQARACIGLALKELETGGVDFCADAQRGLGRLLLDTMRPATTVAEIAGARRLLELMLGAMPEV